MKKVLIVGATGLLGKPLADFLTEKNLDIVKSSRSLGVDFSNSDEAAIFLDNNNPDIIINLAALTDVDKCELDKNTAYNLNVKLVENLVEWSKKSNCFLIHISTDMVYSGQGPHTEDHITPINEYSKTKSKSEDLALSHNRSVVLRTNFFGTSVVESRKSFSDWIIEACLNKTKIMLFNDVYFSPLHISSLCKIIFLVIEKEKYGLFNLGSREGMTKKDFAFTLANKLKFDKSNLIPTSIDEFSFVAKRPKDMRMDVKKFENTYDIELPTLNDEINKINWRGCL